MHTSLHKAVAAACFALAAGAAHAAADPLHNAIITASYNGQPGGMLGADHLFADEAGSNVSALDPIEPGAEFLTRDYLLAFDFAPDGRLTIFNNGALPAGAYSASFDFGATLAAPITGFSVLDAGATSGTPVLSIVNDHTISIDLTDVAWNGDFSAITTAITLQGPVAPVPEPAAAWMMLAGLAGIGMLARRRRDAATPR
ncbi:MAG TPA: VPLPA-CTERM sorting domain-containing protein [Duganella sp.]|uniref:VPLPA-CTERM sorting domain-containing protein n=1 Tax=Duganella sp. TaxID=1904440 RepID=UPI002ED002F7